MIKRATIFIACLFVFLWSPGQTKKNPVSYELHDTHFHLTNYIQQGTDIFRFLEIMGDRVGRVALFGIPLQQVWNYANSGSYGPDYYLATDDPLYYYSFTDAFIAMQYLKLNAEQRQRFDPMITGFNPADMYAVDHIKRVLRTFPGVFSGIGEFTIHKEFVSSKVAGPLATLQNPSLDKIFQFCAQSGLVALIHNDINMPFPKPGQDNWELQQLKDLFKRNPGTTIIWAHCGLGRVVRPVDEQINMIDAMLKDPAFAHVHIDISWTEVAKYITSSKEAMQATASLINRYPTRFIMGTDEVAPTDQQSYLRIMDMYIPFLALLSPATKHALLKGNYERLFDASRIKVRRWESEQSKN